MDTPGQPGQDSKQDSRGIGHLGQSIWNKTDSEQDDENMAANTGQLGRKSRGQECWGRTAGKVMSAQESWVRQHGQDSWNMTTKTGKPWQDSHDNTVGTGHFGPDDRCGNKTGQPGQVSSDRSA
jgi:hypothetical protein